MSSKYSVGFVELLIIAFSIFTIGDPPRIDLNKNSETSLKGNWQFVLDEKKNMEKYFQTTIATYLSNATNISSNEFPK